jgi:ribosome-associated translation inhibitor RaiA
MLEMANLRKKETGLPFNIWIQQSSKRGQQQHGPYRVKVQGNNGDSFQSNSTVSVEIHPNGTIKKIHSSDKKMKTFVQSEINKLEKYLTQNKELLDRYFAGELSSTEFGQQAKRV